MKDYYYILGVKETASLDEIKKAHRKLSHKFHPDKNEGDIFFAERFKEIQEAYEVLINEEKRKEYDFRKNDKSQTSSNINGENFVPIIDFFKTDKSAFEYDEEVTFSWRTVNADKVIIKPFKNLVPSIGQKTYKIKDLKNSYLTFELIAENTNIRRYVNSKVTLKNNTYSDLEDHFKKNNNSNNPNKETVEYKSPKSTTGKIIGALVFIFVLVFVVIRNSNSGSSNDYYDEYGDAVVDSVATEVVETIDSTVQVVDSTLNAAADSVAAFFY